MKFPCIVIDFETEPFVGSPILHPPHPVGVSILWPGMEHAQYLAWGHPCENNTTIEEGMIELDRAYASGLPLLFFNAGFDISVWSVLTCNSAFALRMGNYDWHRIHDGMYPLFFVDPYAMSLQLKPAAEKHLNWSQEDQISLKEWIVSNVPGATKKDWAAHIGKAPGSLVASRGNGDTERTTALFDCCMTIVIEKGMLDAYRREQRLFPICLEATRRGIPVDHLSLIRDADLYTRALATVRERIGKLLGCHPDAVNNDKEFANALEKAGAVTEWVLTPTGKRSMAADNLRISNREVHDLYQYHTAVEGCLVKNILPWIEFSRLDGRLHTHWNQVRQSKDDRASKGARTGRLSSDNPPLMNVPTEWTFSDGSDMPVPAGLPPFPLIRRYCKPEEGHIWLKRDFSSQEVRILAHFENGQLAVAYRSNPMLDPHAMAKELLAQLMSIQLARRPVKIVGFSIIYGTGGPGLETQLKEFKIPLAECYALKEAYLDVFPGVKALMEDVQERGKAGLFVRTWGGRVYEVEPAKEIKGKLRQFYYKLLNYLIQGSAADQTKDVICEWDDARDRWTIFLLTVHDELNLSSPEEHWRRDMARLKQCMDRDRLDVPMRSEGLYGRNWHDLEACE